MMDVIFWARRAARTTLQLDVDDTDVRSGIRLYRRYDVPQPSQALVDVDRWDVQKRLCRGNDVNDDFYRRL